MSILRLLIVDDEPLIRSGIRHSLSQIDGVEVIGECGSGAQAVDAIRQYRPDLVLLDVQMPDFSGVEVVRQIGPEHMPAVIFVTAYDEYAVTAFEMNAVDYLLKPFDDARLRASLARARERLAARNQAELAQRLNGFLAAQERRAPHRIVVRNGDKYEFVPVESIDWVESANNYVQLHCGQRTHLLGEPLSSLEAKLANQEFVRVHRGRLVNTSRITAIHPLFNGSFEIELRDGTRIPTGRQFKHTVQELVKNR